MPTKYLPYIRSVPRRIRAWPIWTWPNFLSVARMLAVLPLWLALQHDAFGVAFVIYVAALVTDFFDGYTARKFNQITDFGKLLDPLADKVLHLFVLYQFQVLYPQLNLQYWLVLWLAVALAILPSFALVLNIQRRLGSNIFGKVKLFFEGLAIVALFSRRPDLAGTLLWIAIALSACSILGHLLIKEGFDYRWWRKRENKK